MKLKSLHLHGFKSFPDRTTLEFREGVTAIVGSNGCGKSNIADAIRWVLGEQRASAIRGAKMEEAIFQGTARRRPLNFAEVTLLFENDRGRVPVPQTEIEVARKVFREGGSEYSLNRNACRLKDIHNLLRDTGLGSNAYAIMEAGMIETLLSDRAEERRLLFEEAAGIGKYKDSRQAALRRLEASEADLARLGDLIGEVESKVRSLSRQRRRAERHRELQARRLALEVALARVELAGLSDALADAERRESELEREQASGGAQRATAETVIEERRTEAADLGQRRAAVSARLEEVRRDLDARERAVLLADERRSHAEMRLEQLARDREEAERRATMLEGEVGALRAERESRAESLQQVRRQLEAQSAEVLRIRGVLAEERSRAEAVAARARDLAREIATAEGERAAAQRTLRAAEERAVELAEAEARLSGELEVLTGQTELWSSRSDELRATRERAEAEVGRARAALERLGEAERSARAAVREAEDRVLRLSTQVDAREMLEATYEGFAPAVAALMSVRARFPGVRGPLADFLSEAASPAQAREVEGYLGPLLQAVVVDDLSVARKIRAWFRDEWTGGGVLLLLPLDALEGSGAGPAVWARSLLSDLVVVDGDPLAEHVRGVVRLGSGGEVVDERGIVRLLPKEEGEGILARREALAAMRVERDTATSELESRMSALATAREEAARAEGRAREAEESLRSVEAELRRMEMDSAAHEHLAGRLREDREILARDLAGVRESARSAESQGALLDRRLTELSAAVQEVGSDDEVARSRLLELEALWESARDQEGELRVAAARAEAELRESERRLAAVEQQIAAAGDRATAIGAETVQLRETIEALAGAREQAGIEMEGLFAARDAETAQLALLDSRLAEVDSELAELGERVRIARRRESEAGEERHRLQLEAAELRSRIERARERLEVEWARPWDALVRTAAPVEDGEPEAWRAELRDLIGQLEGLGPVNMLALEEHEEEARRLSFLTEQRDDLVRARDDLVAAIRQINRTARDLFLTTFESVRENFQRVFQSLFEGGQCDITLADPDQPLESLVEIQASPKGKRTQRIHLLSGGERTLTALALLFALYLVKPSPFCVLDEIDAPLDETNVQRFIQLLNDFKHQTQFIVITHHPRTMEAADWVYGVTMEEPGVSSIVGVELLGTWTAENRVA